MDAAELQLEGQPPVLFFSSHDHPRQWSVFGDGTHNDQIAKLTSALTLTERGCILLYYGEEIGMGTMPQSLLKDFPLSRKRPVADDRDGERTPMQWNTAANASFTSGSPWLPVQSDFSTYNVATEETKPNSIYSWYAKLLKLRHDNPPFRDGSYVPLESANPNVFAFARKAGNSWGLVILNTSATEQAVTITGMPGAWPSFHLIQYSPSPSPLGQKLTIAPYGVLIGSTN